MGRDGGCTWRTASFGQQSRAAGGMETPASPPRLDRPCRNLPVVSCRVPACLLQGFQCGWPAPKETATVEVAPQH